MKRYTKALLVLGIIWLYLSNCFGYNKFGQIKMSYAIECLLYVIPLLMSYRSINKHRNTMYFHNEVILLMILPLISGFSSIMVFKQNIYQTLVAWVPSLLWATYYLLHTYKVPYSKALNFLLLFTFIGVAIMTIQQFIPNQAMFGVLDVNESDHIAEVRNGLYRFRIGGAACAGLFLFTLYFGKLINEYKRKLILISIILALYLYLTLTRQTILAALVVIVATYLMSSKKNISFKSLLFAFILLIFFYFYRDQLFGSFIDQTVEQTSEEDIRLVEYTYFSNEIFTNPMIFIFGTGIPHASSPLGAYYKSLADNYLLFTSDIGIVGTWFNYGIIYIILFLWITYKIIIKMRKYIPTYMKIYYFSVIIILPLAFPWGTNINNMLWAFILYIIDNEITNNKKYKLQ